MVKLLKSVNVEEGATFENKSLLSSREIYKRVKRGDYILKKKKNGKGSRAWE